MPVHSPRVIIIARAAVEDSLLEIMNREVSLSLQLLDQDAYILRGSGSLSETTQVPEAHQTFVSIVHIEHSTRRFDEGRRESSTNLDNNPTQSSRVNDTLAID
jgi:hypothetical protein